MRGVGYIWGGVGEVVGVVRVGEWRLGAGSRRAGTGFARADPSHSNHSATHLRHKHLRHKHLGHKLPPSLKLRRAGRASAYSGQAMFGAGSETN